MDDDDLDLIEAPAPEASRRLVSDVVEVLRGRSAVAPEALALLLGATPDAEERTRFLAGEVLQVADLIGIEFAAEVAACVSLLERSRFAQLRMEVAEDKGLPYSEVRARWTNEDLAMILASKMLGSNDRWTRCDQCGVAEHEVWDDDVRWLDNGRWKIVAHACKWCRELAVANESIPESEKKDGIRAKTVPRTPGDDMVEVAPPRLT